MVTKISPIRKLASAATVTCAASAKIYGQCILASYTDARKDVCAAEFRQFKTCVQTAMKRKW
ncbi:hypothetical protein BU17DRAFT_55268 [Hysterangium stoloniferum]|nr:hypothetical protein BU17DRAFT_55268 [Hysterangium stoloniferum]